MTTTPGNKAGEIAAAREVEPIAWIHKDAAILRQGKTFHPSVAHNYIPVYASPPSPNEAGVMVPDSLMEAAVVFLNSYQDHIGRCRACDTAGVNALEPGSGEGER